jgi:hypothetical protein
MMKRFIVNCLISGTAGGLLSHLAASIRSRKENGPSELPMHAVSHIAWGDAPESHTGRTMHNAVIGTALHHGATIFWATFFEGLFGKRAEQSTGTALVGGATIATAAYITDYHIVSERFKPGFEAYLSNRSLFVVYAALAVGLAAGARLRGLCHHEVEDRDEREERWEAERGPDPLVTPVERR